MGYRVRGFVLTQRARRTQRAAEGEFMMLSGVQIGRRRWVVGFDEIVYDAGDAVLQTNHVEIDDEAQTNAREAEVGEELHPIAGR